MLSKWPAKVAAAPRCNASARAPAMRKRRSGKLPVKLVRSTVSRRRLGSACIMQTRFSSSLLGGKSGPRTVTLPPGGAIQPSSRGVGTKWLSQWSRPDLWPWFCTQSIAMGKEWRSLRYPTPTRSMAAVRPTCELMVPTRRSARLSMKMSKRISNTASRAWSPCRREILSAIGRMIPACSKLCVSPTTCVTVFSGPMNLNRQLPTSNGSISFCSCPLALAVSDAMYTATLVGFPLAHGAEAAAHLAMASAYSQVAK
mmetsp:Transcript_123971/g.355870  ORF Transcript_123971/g.355870 Transcript_123971/m.355870 type:complete len:256 (+) Transcript_123971:967-1734(+)